MGWRRRRRSRRRCRSQHHAARARRSMRTRSRRGRRRARGATTSTTRSGRSRSRTATRARASSRCQPMPSATTPTSTECANLSSAHYRRRVAAALEMRHALRVEEGRAAAQAGARVRAVRAGAEQVRGAAGRARHGGELALHVGMYGMCGFSSTLRAVCQDKYAFITAIIVLSYALLEYSRPAAPRPCGTTAGGR